MEPEPRRRRRLRTGEPAAEAVEAVGEDVDLTGLDDGAVTTAPILDPVASAPTRRPNGEDPPERDAERGLRVLVGAGNSQISIGAAMRARDAARPTDDDVAASAANLVIVRRGWVPRDLLPRAGNS